LCGPRVRGLLVSAVLFLVLYLTYRFTLSLQLDLKGDFDGENWLYAFNRGFSGGYFPAPAVLRALLVYNIPDWLLWLRHAVYLIPVLLAFAAGAFMYSASAGLIAAVCVALVAPVAAFGGCEYLILISSALGFIIADTLIHKNGIRKQILISLLLCALLQSKGVAFPLVLIFIFYPLFTSERKIFLKLRLLPISSVLAVSLAWGLVNTSSGNKFVFFTEDSERAVENICAGLYGLTSTTEGDAHGRILCRNREGNENIYLYAVRETLKRPADFFIFALRRADYLFFRAMPYKTYLPFIFSVIGFIAPFFRSNRRKPLLLLWLSAVTVFFIQLTMPVQLNYFTPAIVFFSAVSGLAAGRFAGGTSSRRAAGAVFYPAALLCPVLWLFSFALMSAYPFRIKSGLPDPVSLAVKHPRNILFQRLAGDRMVTDCRAGSASVYYGNMYSAGASPKLYWRQVQSMFLRGDDINWRVFADKNWRGDYPTVVYYGLNAYDRGRLAEAREAMSCALQLCMVTRFYVRNAKTGTEMAMNDEMRKIGASYCINQALNSVGQLSDRKRKRNIKANIQRSDPSLFDAGALYSLYDSERRKYCAVRGRPDDCQPGFASESPDICKKFLPDFMMLDNNIMVSEADSVGYPACSPDDGRNKDSRYFNKYEKKLFGCFASSPDFNNLKPYLDACTDAIDEYESLGEEEKDAVGDCFIFEAEFQKSNILKVMGRKKEARAEAENLIAEAGAESEYGKKGAEFLKTLR